jgi:cell wall-associated NlpC family hydrolase
MGAICNYRKYIVLALIGCALACVSSSAQNLARARGTSPAQSKQRLVPVTLTKNDGLTVVATAFDPHSRPRLHRDCSHLVHAIYDRAGFSYPYAESSDLYRGTDHFRRVKHPQPGDLVVWIGHVGIVVNPARRIFFSELSRGPGTDRYDAQYWRQRGPAKFYRYIKTE